MSQVSPLVAPLKMWMQAYQISNSNRLLEQLLGHPEYPRLSAIMDTFKQQNVEVIAGKCDALTDLPSDTNILLQLIGKGLVYVDKINDNIVSYTDNEGNLNRQHLDDFSFMWSGVFLFPQPNPNAKTTKKSKEKFWWISKGWLSFVFILILLLALSAINYSTTILYSSLLGLLVCSQILYLKISPFSSARSCGDKVIGNICEDITQSKYATLLKRPRIDFIDLTVSYFTLILVLYFLNAASLGVLSSLILGGNTAIAYSVYVQGFKIRRWCKYCLRIILIQVAMTLTIVWHGIPPFTIMNIFIPYSAMLGVLFVWKMTKNEIGPRVGFVSDLFRYKRIALSKNTFQSVLQCSPTYCTLPPLDNSEIQNRIVFVLSPTCPRCGKLIEEILESGLNERIPSTFDLMFVVENSIRNEYVTIFNRAQSKMSDNHERLMALSALHKGEWPEVSISYATEDLQAYSDQSDWLSKNSIKTYPFILINNKSAPIDYTTDELFSLL